MANHISWSSIHNNRLSQIGEEELILSQRLKNGEGQEIV
jgi:hypothetical protein